MEIVPARWFGDKKVWLGVAVAGVFFGLGMMAGRGREGVPIAGELKGIVERRISSTPEPTKGALRTEYVVPKVVPEGWEGLTFKNESYEKRTYTEGVIWNTTQYFFPGGQAVVLPGLLEDYNFVSMNNYGGDKGQAEMELSVETFRYREPFYSSFVRGVLYGDGKGVWLKGEVTLMLPKRDVESQPVVLAHAVSKAVMEQMIVELGEFTSQEEPPEEGGGIDLIHLRRVSFAPNYTDRGGKFRYYRPPGYQLNRTGEGVISGNAEVIRKSTGENLCLALAGEATDQCQFSTSGCTCCNTGCELLGLVAFEDWQKSLRIEPILQKGTLTSAGVRFVYYDEANPNLYYSAAFSSPKNDQRREVLNLFYAVESLEKVK